MPVTTATEAYHVVSTRRSESERQRQLKEATGKMVETTGAERFRDVNELKFAMRSLRTHMPWTRRIFLVTSGEAPTWLNTSHPLVTLVRHDELFTNPQISAPSFSSNAIEAVLHRIPGLSDNFLYLNDDVFVTAPVPQHRFWSPAQGLVAEVSTAPTRAVVGRCDMARIGDGICDPSCMNDLFQWDLGDCERNYLRAPAAWELYDDILALLPRLKYQVQSIASNPASAQIMMMSRAPTVTSASPRVRLPLPPLSARELAWAATRETKPVPATPAAAQPVTARPLTNEQLLAAVTAAEQKRARAVTGLERYSADQELRAARLAANRPAYLTNRDTRPTMTATKTSASTTPTSSVSAAHRYRFGDPQFVVYASEAAPFYSAAAFEAGLYSPFTANLTVAELPQRQRAHPVLARIAMVGGHLFASRTLTADSTNSASASAIVDTAVATAAAKAARDVELARMLSHGLSEATARPRAELIARAAALASRFGTDAKVIAASVIRDLDLVRGARNRNRAHNPTINAPNSRFDHMTEHGISVTTSIDANSAVAPDAAAETSSDADAKAAAEIAAIETLAEADVAQGWRARSQAAPFFMTTEPAYCAPGCPSAWARDGVCDAACDVASCDFDGGDCALSFSDHARILQDALRYDERDTDKKISPTQRQRRRQRAHARAAARQLQLMLKARVEKVVAKQNAISALLGVLFEELGYTHTTAKLSTRTEASEADGFLAARVEMFDPARVGLAEVKPPDELSLNSRMIAMVTDSLRRMTLAVPYNVRKSGVRHDYDTLTATTRGAGKEAARAAELKLRKLLARATNKTVIALTKAAQEQPAAAVTTIQEVMIDSIAATPTTRNGTHTTTHNSSAGLASVSATGGNIRGDSHPSDNHGYLDVDGIKKRTLLKNTMSAIVAAEPVRSFARFPSAQWPVDSAQRSTGLTAPSPAIQGVWWTFAKQPVPDPPATDWYTYLTRSQVTLQKLTVNTVGVTTPHVPFAINKHVYARLQYLAADEYAEMESTRFRAPLNMQMAYTNAGFLSGAKHPSLASLVDALFNAHDADCDGVLRGNEVKTLLRDIFTVPNMYPRLVTVLMRERAHKWPFAAPLMRPFCRTARDAAAAAAVARRIAAGGVREHWDFTCIVPSQVYDSAASADSDDIARESPMPSDWSVARAATLYMPAIPIPRSAAATTQTAAAAVRDHSGTSGPANPTVRLLSTLGSNDAALSRMVAAAPWLESSASAAGAENSARSVPKDHVDIRAVVLTPADLVDWPLGRAVLEHVQLPFRPMYHGYLHADTTWSYLGVTSSMHRDVNGLLRAVSQTLAGSEMRPFSCINDASDGDLPDAYLRGVKDMYEKRFPQKAPWEI